MTLTSKHVTKKIKSKNQRCRNMKKQNTEKQKPSFPKEYVENEDLYKPVLTKIMTTCK